MWTVVLGNSRWTSSGGIGEDSFFPSSKVGTEHPRESLAGNKYLHGVALKLARFPVHTYCPRAHEGTGSATCYANDPRISVSLYSITFSLEKPCISNTTVISIYIYEHLFQSIISELNSYILTPKPAPSPAFFVSVNLLHFSQSPSIIFDPYQISLSHPMPPFSN